MKSDKIITEIKIHFDLNDNENTTYKNLTNVDTTVIMRQFGASKQSVTYKS